MADRRRNSGIPSGVVFPFAGTAAPYGYLICDGRAVSRTDYPDLFLTLGTSHGQGDVSTTFNLPDYRGRFLRGVDGLAGNDPDKAGRAAANTGGNTGNSVGSVQGDTVQSHAHISGIYGIGSGYSVYGDASVAAGNRFGTSSGSSVSPYTGGPVSDATSSNIGGTPRTSSESRPKNVNVNYIIKV